MYFCPMRILLSAILLLTSGSIAAQGAKTKTQTGNTYRSTTNPLYWKNKKPYEGYWQQDVYYRIDARLDDEAEVITGNEEMVYYNNSPNTLYEAYFHLYQNAVQPGSLVDDLYNANKTPHKFGKYEAQKLGTEILSCEVNGATAAFSVDYTVMKIKLNAPLKSGDSMVFKFGFKTYFDRGTIRRRMKVYDHDGFKHFNGVHWYPRICVYDRKFAWETAQHMEHEFYGDFGAYDVSLTLPNEYVLEATGELQNPEEAYPGDLRARLDIANFKERLPNDKPGLVAPKNGTYKTWRYHATNVHDFAWTADPTYRIGEVVWNGIHCIALPQEQNAWRWQPSAGFVANVIATYSQDFGMYEYPKMVAADAADGMEYPMLTLDGGNFPGHRGLIAHEVGHNWFFGMIGSNETYRAALDEGFTQFLTAWSMKKLTGQNQRPSDIEYSTNYFGYLRDAIDGNDPTLNTHSDDFHNAIGHGGGYGHVYYKTATMLYNLEYVLGDSVFRKAMQNYVQQWKICHPYIEDFRNSIIMSAGADLNWFFDQWFETSKYIDYSVKKVKSSNGNHTITLQRKGDMIMPLDLRITMADGNHLDITVPVSGYQKPGSIGPPQQWTGWGNLRKTYKLSFSGQTGIKQVKIDPSGRLADIDQRNNTWKRRYTLQFDRENELSRDNRGGYQFYWRPDIWYSYIDGIRGGLKLSGNYAARKHIFNLYLWGQTSSNQLISDQSHKAAYWFDYRNHLRKKGEIVLASRYLASLWMHKAGWEKTLGKGRISTGLKYMQRVIFSEQSLPYRPAPAEAVLKSGYLPSQSYWSAGSNISLNAAYIHNYRGFNNSGSWELSVRTSAPWSDAEYGWLRAQWINTLKIGKTQLRTRAFAQSGSGNMSPAESMIYASGANPEEAQDNKYARDWATQRLGNDAINRNLHLGGGLNLRGFSGYPLTHADKDTIRTFYRGNQGASVNAEFDFSGLFANSPKIRMVGMNLYLFGDAGIIAYPVSGRMLNSGVVADAGLGAVIHIKNWNLLAPRKAQPIMTAVSPLSIRFDMPVFVSAVPAHENHLAFRWMLGINRAF